MSVFEHKQTLQGVEYKSIGKIQVAQNTFNGHLFC